MNKVILLLPTYNEKEIIGTMIGEALKNISAIAEFDINILVVDSNSPDGTGKIVEEMGKNNSKIQLLTVKERGLGLGLVKGYEYAFNALGADILLQMDADLQHNPKDIPKLLFPFTENCNFVQGSRFIKGGGNNLEPHRRFLSWAANLTARILFGAMKIHEFTTSFRAFSKEVWQKIDFNKVPHRGKSFIFQPAFLQAIIEQHVEIKEVPIIFTDRKKGYSKMDMVQYSFELLRYGLKIRAKKHAKFIKFCIVGTSGLIVQTIIFTLLKNRYEPFIATGIGAEAAIINGFYWNNKWTYKEHKISRSKKMLYKFLQFNLICIGSIIIQMITLYLGPKLLGKTQVVIWLFYFLGICLGLIWNYYFYGKIVWKKK